MKHHQNTPLINKQKRTKKKKTIQITKSQSKTILIFSKKQKKSNISSQKTKKKQATKTKSPGHKDPGPYKDRQKNKLANKG